MQLSKYFYIEELWKMHEIYSNILFKFIECWNQKDMESITSSAIYLVGGFEQRTQSL